LLSQDYERKSAAAKLGWQTRRCECYACERERLNQANRRRRELGAKPIAMFPPLYDRFGCDCRRCRYDRKARD
jgi:hypothetical protein